MTRTFRPKLDILPATQRSLWPKLRPLRKIGFVLYGGTAIALQLGHRQSIDFDFFSSNNLNKENLWTALPLLSNSTLIQDEKNTLSVLVHECIKLSFFGGLGFGRFGHVKITEDEVLAVASLEDLLALKIKALFDRSEAKDYKDIAAILRSGIALETGLSIAARMFHPRLSPILALKALTYFEGGDLKSLPLEDMETLTAAASSLRSIPKVKMISKHLAENF